MNFVPHATTNDLLRAPTGVPSEECGDLPITRIRFNDAGGVAVASYWMPDADELRRLNEGQPVRLTVLGRTHPPLAVAVDGDGWI